MLQIHFKLFGVLFLILFDFNPALTVSQKLQMPVSDYEKAANAKRLL